ncbi:hypothetical protein Smp_161620 [Schistosoma mansoni]|uniref:hypothetical protein n=1 Tax=Schistosoma mansoni TaxID=6183 RepID=UPI0001A61DCC|nr:hypothetical protein Smp_161620 [Schistosoma mansoni]|eukprot:XP_018653368.1 hypothetical protein Smp_161620 [Schistosoma mansoni]
MPFPTDPRLASYFLPGYPAAIAAAMAAVNAASHSLSSSPCLTTCSPSSSTSSSLPSMTKSTSSIWNMNPAAVVAAAAAAGTASSFWSSGCSSGGGGGGGSSSTSSGYASSEGSGGSSGTNGSNWLHHSAISPGSNSSIGGNGSGSCGSGFNFLQYPYPRQHNLFNQKHYLRSSNDGDDLLSCIRRESPSFDRSVYFSNNNHNNNNNTNFSYTENHPIDYNLSGQMSRFSNLYNDPVRNSANLMTLYHSIKHVNTIGVFFLFLHRLLKNKRSSSNINNKE